jgi:thioredoxin 1
MGTHVTTLTDDTFDEEVMGSDRPVLVDFWAEWCGPCKMLSPVIEDIAAEHGNKVRFAKLNVDEELAVTQRYGVMSMPTLMVFRDGEPVKRLVGARGKSVLLEELSEFLG